MGDTPAAMAAMGLITSVLAPAVVLAASGADLWRRAAVPAPAAAAGFVVLHAIVTAGMSLGMPTAAMALARPVLFAGAVLFWLPVFGPPPGRLSGPGATVYLFVTAPSLDLAAIFVFAHGHPAAGAAMIVAMMPIGVIAIAVTWQWISREERETALAEAAAVAGAGAAGAARGDGHTGPGGDVPPGNGRPLRVAPPRGPRKATAQVARWGITRRQLRLTLAVFWLSAAALQALPAMFTPRFARQVLEPAAAGQPAVLAGVIRQVAAVVAAHPAAANALFVAVQAVIGAALLRRRTARPALLASIGWALAVWVAGEGAGGVLTGMASVVTGSPGAALLYALLAAAALPDRGRDRPGPEVDGPPGEPPREPPPGWLPPAWAAVWLLMLLTGPWPERTGSGHIAAGLARSAAELPAGLRSAVTAFAAAAGRHALTATVALMLVQAVIAVAAARPGVSRRAAAVLGAAVAVMCWVTGEAFGGLAGGLATDVGAGPPMAALALAVWSAGGLRAGRPAPPAPRPFPAQGRITAPPRTAPADTAGAVRNGPKRPHARQNLFIRRATR